LSQRILGVGLSRVGSVGVGGVSGRRKDNSVGRKRSERRGSLRVLVISLLPGIFGGDGRAVCNGVSWIATITTKLFAFAAFSLFVSQMSIRR
jgi:hypothetical protein